MLCYRHARMIPSTACPRFRLTLIMMPVQDICTADCSQTVDVEADDPSDEDAESYYKSCWSYISDSEDGDDIEEPDCSGSEDDEAICSSGNMGIDQLTWINEYSWRWVPLQPSDVRDLDFDGVGQRMGFGK
ncbi:hypothetical protein BDZ89DRAFT_532396 [Hymenopellis radicata]|nr:hypothetical protein BDZ89DRAFT_532396 [Hymenopellis radicata]